MGMNPGWLRHFSELADANNIVKGDRFLDVGTSELFCADDPASLNDFLARFGAEPYRDQERDRMANRGLASELFIRAGLKYTSIDFADYPHTIRLDLNWQSLPVEHWGRYKFVSNSGTSEHILNQFNVFETIHNATAQDGLMYHGLPMGGDFSHGLFSYNPKFFWALAKANEYEIVRFWGWSSSEMFTLPSSFSKDIHFNVLPHSNNHALHILLRRKTMEAFKGLIDPAFSAA
jgi:hypothetical protein